MGDLESRVGYLESYAVMKDDYRLDQEKQNVKLRELDDITKYGRIEAVAGNVKDIRERQKKHTAILNRHTEQLDQLTTDVAGLKTDVAGLKTDVAGLKTDVAGLKTDMTWVKSTLGEILNRLPAKPEDPSTN
jgi:chromosome segregation ATPase